MNFESALSTAIANHNAQPSDASRDEVQRARGAALLHAALSEHLNNSSDDSLERVRAARDALRECLLPKVRSRSTQERRTSLMIHYLPPKTSPTTSRSIGPLDKVLRTMSADLAR